MIATCRLQHSMLLSPVWGLNAPRFSLEHRIWICLHSFIGGGSLEEKSSSCIARRCSEKSDGKHFVTVLYVFSKLNINNKAFQLPGISLLQLALNRNARRQLDSESIGLQALIAIARNKQFLLQIASEENRFEFSLWKRLKKPYRDVFKMRSIK